MNIRCIALDLDRTTLDGQGRLSPGNREALCRAIDKGVHVVIASGRACSTLPRDVTELSGIEYAITSNGAAVYHLPTGRCLRRFALTSASVEQLLELTKDEPLVYEAFIDGKAYADADYVRDPVAHGATVKAIPYIQSTRQPVEDIRSFILSNRSALDSIDLVIGAPEVKQRLWKSLSQAIPDFYITASVPELLELSHRDAGKHSGVKFVARQLGISLEEVAAFGDGDNDADMLACVGCGIAMENATPGCKAAADYITRHHADDGVAYAIENLLKL